MKLMPVTFSTVASTALSIRIKGKFKVDVDFIEYPSHYYIPKDVKKRHVCDWQFDYDRKILIIHTYEGSLNYDKSYFDKFDKKFNDYIDKKILKHKSTKK